MGLPDSFYARRFYVGADRGKLGLAQNRFEGRAEAAATQTSGEQGGEQWPAGWYEDPHEPTGQRWWDGSRWTDHVSG